MFTAPFWRATLERAVRTLAQTLVALLTSGATGLLDVDWPQSLSVAGLAALLSVLTSVAAAGVGPGGPSLGPEALTEEQR